MNSTDLIERGEEKLNSKSVAIIGVGVIALGVLITWLNKIIRDVPETELPPIIIKSGSFIIDSVDGFRDAGDITGNPKRKKINQYKGSFGVVKSVLVNQINEKSLGSTPFGYRYRDTRGVIIQLWFQKLTSENPEIWDPADIGGVPDVVNRLSTPLAMELPDDLTKSNQNKHHKRKNKDKLDFKKATGGTDRYFRIGRIRILDVDGNVKRDISSNNGDEYFISLWDIYIP
jgi:hypothetical protein